MSTCHFNTKLVYEKNPKLKKSDVEALLKWCEKQSHLPILTEFQAILFLHSCCYSNEAAKTAIDTFFTMRTLCPELFREQNLSLPTLKKTIESSLCTVLPKKTSDDCSIILIQFMDSNPENFFLLEFIKYFDMVSMLQLYQDGPSNGHIIIVDLKGISLGHLGRLGISGPSTIRKMLLYLQEAMPLKLKAIHFINIVSFMDTVLGLIKPFMKNELLHMVLMHDSIQDLENYVPRECLPKDYDGLIDSVEILHDKNLNNLLENKEFFRFEDGQLVDESKRPKNSKNLDNIFGIDGTFKKLEID